MADGSVGSYVWQTYPTVLARIRHIGSGFTKLNLGPRSFVGLYSVNRPEWYLAEQAALMFSMVTVPLYDTLGKQAIEFICQQTKMSVVVCSKDKAKVLVEMGDALLDLQWVVVMDALDDELKQAFGASRRIHVVMAMDLMRC